MKQILLGLMLFITTLSFGQTTGKVVESETNEPLPGATIVVKGTSIGSVTDFDGNFSIDAEVGSEIVISFLGYEELVATLKSGATYTLVVGNNTLNEVVVTSGVIDIAKVRETPIALSTISPAEISLKMGNQEFPEIMNKTPGVYATKQGGGYGDSRISLRGFDKTNT